MTEHKLPMWTWGAGARGIAFVVRRLREVVAFRDMADGAGLSARATWGVTPSKRNV